MKAPAWEFAKYHGLGNDFLVGADGPRFRASLAAAICDRRRGPGADGIVLIGEPGPGGVPLRLFNSDGSAATFSGNGVRCAGAYLLDTGAVRGTVALLPPAGPVRVRRVRAGGVELSFRLELMRAPGDPPIRPIRLSGLLRARVSRAYHVVLGNPHVIGFVTGRTGAVEPLDAECERLRRPGRRFPDGVNVSLLSSAGRGRYRMFTWERGVGRSSSCASAATAAFHAGTELGMMPRRVTLLQEGGTLEVARDGDRLVLSGPITRVYSGRI